MDIHRWLAGVSNIRIKEIECLLKSKKKIWDLSQAIQIHKNRNSQQFKAIFLGEHDLCPGPRVSPLRGVEAWKKVTTGDEMRVLIILEWSQGSMTIYHGHPWSTIFHDRKWKIPSEISSTAQHLDMCCPLGCSSTLRKGPLNTFEAILLPCFDCSLHGGALPRSNGVCGFGSA